MLQQYLKPAWALFMSDPLTVVVALGIALYAGWLLRGLFHRERIAVLTAQIDQARRDADNFSNQFVRAEAKFIDLQGQITKRAPQEAILVTAEATASSFSDLRAANNTLQGTLNAEGGRYGLTGNPVTLTITRADGSKETR